MLQITTLADAAAINEEEGGRESK